MTEESAVSIEPWGVADRPLLGRLLGDPRMMGHLGGPESDEKLDERQSRYEKPGSRQYKVLFDGQPCGSVGYWQREWAGRSVWEAGWAVVPEYQGRGIASQGMRLLIEVVRGASDIDELDAFPSVDNAASNAVCLKVGFDLIGPFDFEYPPGHPLRCNDWRLYIRRSGSLSG